MSKRSKKYYIIAGEASGDLHGANLIEALKKREQNPQFICWGGDHMKAASGNLHQHYRELNFMGFVEVIKNLRTILSFLKKCKNHLLEEKPDALILIDYPGFNLRIAKFAKKHNIPIYYYISPQVWAWNSSRVKKIKKLVRKMLVILPFERAFYLEHGFQVDFVGHPLIDAIDNWDSETNFRKRNQLDDRPIIALLPGSRNQEIKRMLPLMLEQIPHFPKYQFVIAGSPSQPEEFYWKFCENCNVKLVQNNTYDLLQIAEAALVTSGTATLETGLFGVPQVVCYKGNALSYEIGKRLVKVKYISLVNLILDKPAVKELIQRECNTDNIRKHLGALLQSISLRDGLKKDYIELKRRLGNGGASKRAAELISEDLEHFLANKSLFAK